MGKRLQQSWANWPLGALITVNWPDDRLFLLFTCFIETIRATVVLGKTNCTWVRVVGHITGEKMGHQLRFEKGKASTHVETKTGVKANYVQKTVRLPFSPKQCSTKFINNYKTFSYFINLFVWYKEIKTLLLRDLGFILLWSIRFRLGCTVMVEHMLSMQGGSEFIPNTIITNSQKTKKTQIQNQRSTMLTFRGIIFLWQLTSKGDFLILPK